MPPDRHQHLSEAIRAIDARLRPLVHAGIKPPQVLTPLRDVLLAAFEQFQRQQPEVERMVREDNALLPAMLELYRSGSDDERAALRALLAECSSFRWGFGWGSAGRVSDAATARDALAILSMTDGGSDWRDEIVALDHICAEMQRAGLPVAALLREAAALSSDAQRFPPVWSTRELLLNRAGRFTT
jgi:hypothetical protein